MSVWLMEKAFEMGKASATGSLQLLIGVATSTIVMAIGSIVLGRLLTPDEYGLYAISLIPSTMINLFRDWGVNSAMTRYIANSRVLHKDEEIHDIMFAGLVFEVASGLALSFLSLLLASFIASTVFHRPESAYYIAILSISIISGSLLAASQGGFVGFERMKLNTFTLVSQAIVRTAVGPILVIVGYSVLGAVVGYTISFVAAAIMGLVAFYLALVRPLKKKQIKNSNMTKTLKEMLTFGAPLSIASMLVGLLVQIYAFMVVSFVSNSTYGNYQVAVNFSTLLNFFTVPIATVLFPAFSKLDPKNEPELVKRVFASSIKYTCLLVLPATLGMIALSGPMIRTLYGEKYVYAPFYLSLYLVGNLFPVLGSISIGSLLSGLGETRVIMKQGIITVLIGIPLSILLIPALGIIGLMITAIIDGIPSFIWIVYWTLEHHDVKVDLRSLAKILVASATAALMAYAPTLFLNIADWTKLSMGLIIFLTVYIVGAPIIGAVSLTDIDNLKIIFSNLGFVSKIINITLNAAEKAAKLRSVETAFDNQAPG